MTEHKHSYRNVLNATSLFGGVQVINIIISTPMFIKTHVYLKIGTATLENSNC